MNEAIEKLEKWKSGVMDQSKCSWELKVDGTGWACARLYLGESKVERYITAKEVAIEVDGLIAAIALLGDSATKA